MDAQIKKWIFAIFIPLMIGILIGHLVGYSQMKYKKKASDKVNTEEILKKTQEIENLKLELAACQKGND